MVQRTARLGAPLALVVILLVMLLIGCGGGVSRTEDELAVVRVTVAAASTQTAVRAAELVGALTQTPVDVAMTAMAPTLAMAGMEQLPQWAITASASSERGSPEWSALQVTGEPNTLECIDAETAWESAEPNTVSALTVAFSQLVTPERVNIYESFNPGYVTSVEIRDVYGELHMIYQAEPAPTVICPRMLTIPLENVDYRANVVIVTVNQMNAPGGRSAIDAVQLIGTR